MPQTFTKDPSDVLDYMFDWSDWLASGETISTYVLTVPTGITKDSESNTGTTVTIWLSGGTSGASYEIACKITTATRTVEKSIFVHVANN